MQRPHSRRFAPALLLALCLSAGQACATEAFEPPPQLFPSEMLAPELLGGPLHTVVAPVVMDGFLATVAFDSPHGRMRAASLELLPERIAELAAIDALSRIEKSAAFGDSLARAATAPVELAGKLLSDPGKTLDGVGSGIGRVLNQAGNLVRSGVDSVADAASDLASGSKQAAAAGDETPPPAASSDPFGYNKARRQWAQQLKVDPYTSNPLLRQMLDDIATATFAGSFAIDTTLSLVAAPVKYAVDFDAESRDAIWNMSPGDVEARNEARLLAMGIEGRPVRDLFRNTWFTPTLQTRLVGALELLDKVGGRTAAIERAAATRGEMRARSLIGALDLLAGAHKAKPLAELRLSDTLVLATRADGELLAALSADYLYWNEAAATLAATPAPIPPTMPAAGVPRRTLLIPGQASVRARQELERAGWTLVEGRPSAAPPVASPVAPPAS